MDDLDIWRSAKALVDNAIAAVLAHSGQSPPAASAIDNSGLQLSAFRLCMLGGMAGSALRNTSSLSSSQRTICRAKMRKWSMRSLRNPVTCSSGFLRCSSARMERSANVPGSAPMFGNSALADASGGQPYPTSRIVVVETVPQHPMLTATMQVVSVQSTVRR